MSIRLYKIILLCILPSTLLFSQYSIFTNDFGMKLILIKPGSMIVGRFQPTVFKTSQLSDSVYKLALEMAKRDAMPGFKVEIGHPYYIGQFEVTQKQWKK